MQLASQRQAVKKIAAEVDNEIRHLDNLSADLSASSAPFHQHWGVLQGQGQRLLALRNAGLSAVAPQRGVIGAAKSGVVLAGGAVTHGCAAAASGAVGGAHALAQGVGYTGLGVADVGLSLVTQPVVSGIAGGVAGAKLHVSLLKPLTAVGGAAAGVVAGAAYSVVMPAAYLPMNLAKVPRSALGVGSPMRKLFIALDKYPAAKARAARKKISTQAMADEIITKLQNARSELSHERPASTRVASSLMRSCTGSPSQEVLRVNDEGMLTDNPFD